MTVRDALEQHYVNHGLPADGGANSPTFRIVMGPVSLTLPNPPARKRALFYHDTNHVLTGYNTVFTQGEVNIAAFELGNGCGPFLIAWIINLGAFAVGLFTAPSEMFRSFVRGRRASSIYDRQEPTDALAAMTVDALRTSLGIDARAATPTLTDGVLFGVWAVAALVLWMVPAAGVVLIVR